MSDFRVPLEGGGVAIWRDKDGGIWIERRDSDRHLSETGRHGLLHRFNLQQLASKLSLDKIRGMSPEVLSQFSVECGDCVG